MTVPAATGEEPSQPSSAGTGPDWLILLRRLTESTPRWLSWKNVESALAGVGDIDSVAPREDWDRVEVEFRRWAFEHGLGPVVVCPHAPFLLHLVALSSERSEFYELDVNRRKVFLGSTLFLPEDLLPLAIMDERGFRRLRPGAEGILKLVQNGMLRDGRPNQGGLASKGIPESLRQDPEGVRGGARLFGPAADAVLRAARALMEGDWDRWALLEMEGWFLARAVTEPDSVRARIRFRINVRRCPVLSAVVLNHRRIGEEPETWVRRVSQTHRVYTS